MTQFGSDYHRGPSLATRDKRTLAGEELAAVVAEARRDGLLATADRHQLTPSDLYRLAAPPRSQGRERRPPPRADRQQLPADPWAEVVE